jgi:hypothetical protein
MWTLKTLDDAHKLGLNKRKSGFDVLIIKKNVVFNAWSSNEDVSYIVERFGYYKVYIFLNKIILAFVFILLAIFLYLYFKFVKK